MGALGVHFMWYGWLICRVVVDTMVHPRRILGALRWATNTFASAYLPTLATKAVDKMP